MGLGWEAWIYEGTIGPCTPGRWWAPGELGGGWPPTVLGSRPRAIGRPPLPWPQADHCQTSPASCLYPSPLGHGWARHVASSSEGMQTWLPAAIPAVLQAGQWTDQPDGYGELGEWVHGGDEQSQTSAPLGIDALSEAYPPTFSPPGTDTHSHGPISLRPRFSNWSGHLASSWRDLLGPTPERLIQSLGRAWGFPLPTHSP